MKLYVKASKEYNLKLLKSFVGKDEWVLVNILNYYSGKVLRRALIKIDKIYGDVFFKEIPLSFDYAHNYDNALGYVVDEHTSLDNCIKKYKSVHKDCVKVVEPVESYTTEELRKAIEQGE